MGYSRYIDPKSTIQVFEPVRESQGVDTTLANMLCCMGSAYISGGMCFSTATTTGFRTQSPSYPDVKRGGLVAPGVGLDRAESDSWSEGPEEESPMGCTSCKTQSTNPGSDVCGQTVARPGGSHPCGIGGDSLGSFWYESRCFCLLASPPTAPPPSERD